MVNAIAVYAVVSNMSLAMERRDLLKDAGCVVCNLQEAGMLFGEDLTAILCSSGGEAPASPENRLASLARDAGLSGLIVTLGADGVVVEIARGAVERPLPDAKA